MPELADMPDLSAAMERLEAAEAAETPAPVEAFVQQGDPNDPQPPAGQPGEGTEPPSDLPTGTPAAAEATAAGKVENPNPEPAAKPAAEKKPEPKPGETPAQSQFAKDKARRDDSWKALNGQKEQFSKDQAMFKAERDYFEREKRQFEEQKAKASARYTPEQYEQGAAAKLEQANQFELQADGLDKRADALENDDKYAEAQKLRDQAKGLREEASFNKGTARRLSDMARHTRENPDPTAEQVKARTQQAIRDYTMAAAKSWPDMAKEGSEFQKQVVGHIQEARKGGLDVNDHPVLLYHAARLTAAETAAARVPGMEKELGELRAKVKELEALTNPGGGESAAQNLQHDRQNSDEEEGAALRGIALTI